MYTKKKTNINMHKSWHVTSGVMLGRIEQAQEKAALAAKMSAIREKEREKELEQKYYHDLQAKAGVISKRERLDWMYEMTGPKPSESKSGVEMVSSDVLSAVGATDAVKGEIAAAAQPVPTAKKPIAIDLEAKIREDPMFAIKQAQLQSFQQQFDNPMFALALQQRKKKLQEKEDRKAAKKAEKKKEKKDKKAEKKKEKKKSKRKDKKDKKRKRSSSSSSSSSSSASSSSAAGGKDRSRRANHGVDSVEHLAKRRRASSDEGKPALLRHPPIEPHSARYQRPTRQVLTDAERAERLRQMEEDGRRWEKERADRITAAAHKAEKEAEADAVTHMGSKYLAEINKKVMEQTLSDRLQRKHLVSKASRREDDVY